ncbi:MAG: hypothetical protein MJZ26_10320 [Fibrobacter sp.]|nr:hypothetical protein [Fibrobacter sp.]
MKRMGKKFLGVLMCASALASAAGNSVDTLYWSDPSLDFGTNGYSDSIYLHYSIRPKFTASFTTDDANAKANFVESSTFYREEDNDTTCYITNSGVYKEGDVFYYNIYTPQPLNADKTFDSYAMGSSVGTYSERFYKMFLIAASPTGEGETDTVYSKNTLRIYSFAYVNFASGEDGTVSLAVADSAVSIGNKISSKATANEGFEFACWANKDKICVSSNPEITVLVKRDTALTAVYSETGTAMKKVNLALSGDADSYLTYTNDAYTSMPCDTKTEGGCSVQVGSTVTLGSYDGNTISNVSVNDNTVEVTKQPDGSYTFTMPADAVTLSAKVERIKYKITNTNDKVVVYSATDTLTPITETIFGDSIIITTANKNYGLKSLNITDADGNRIYPDYYHFYSVGMSGYIMPAQEIVLDVVVDTTYQLSVKNNYSYGSVTYFSTLNDGYGIEKDTIRFGTYLQNGYNSIDTIYCVAGTDTLSVSHTDEERHWFVMPNKPVECEVIAIPNEYTVSYSVTDSAGNVKGPEKSKFASSFNLTVTPKFGYQIRSVSYLFPASGNRYTPTIVDPDKFNNRIGAEYIIEHTWEDEIEVSVEFEKIPYEYIPTFDVIAQKFFSGYDFINTETTIENSCIVTQSRGLSKADDITNYYRDTLVLGDKYATYYTFSNKTTAECLANDTIKAMVYVAERAAAGLDYKTHFTINGKAAPDSILESVSFMDNGAAIMLVRFEVTAEAKSVKVVHNVLEHGKITGLPELAIVDESVKFSVVPDSGYVIARVEFTSDAIDSNVVLKPADASKFDPSKSTEYVISSIPDSEVSVWVYFRKLFTGESPAFEFTVSNTEDGMKSAEFEMLPKNSCLDVTTSNIYKGTSISSANILKGSDTFKEGETYTAAYTFNANLDGDCGKDANLTTARDMIEAAFYDLEFKPSMKITVDGKEVAFDSVWDGGVSAESYVTFNLKYTFTATEAKEAIMVMAAKPQFNVTTAGRNLLISGARAGSTYAVMDMQGRVMQRGTMSTSNFEMAVPHAGSYMIRINNQMQRVNVK